MSRPEEQTPYLAASRLRALVDHLRIGVLVEDDQRRVAAVNEEFCRLFSLPVSPADLVGADCAEAAEALKHLFVAPDDFLRRIDELLRTRETVEAEEIRLADGRMFERDSIPILDDSVAMGHLWQYRDVTESLERARALQRSNELLRALGKAQQQYIQTADPGAVFNTLLEDLLSLTDSEYGFIGEVLLDRQGRYLKTHAITNIAWNEETRDFYEQNAPTGMVFRNLDTLFGAVMRDGETVIANSPSTDPRRGGLPEGHPDLNAFLGLPFFLGNEMIGMVGIANRPGGYDEALIRELEPFLATCTSVVSAFRTASQLLRSEHRTGAIMDASIDAVVMIDADGLIIEFNPAAERIFGYRRADVIGRSMGEVIVPPALRSTHERGMERYLATGKPRVLDRRLELTGMRADGSEFPVEVSITRLPEVDPPIFVGSLRDITDRVSSQRALELAKEAAEGANRAKSEFLATVSHEIRTPLNVIMGMTEVASEQAATPDQRELLEIVLTNAQSLLQVIDEILDISKIEAGRMEVTPAVTRLVDIIEDVCVSLAPRAHEKGLELLFELSPDLPEAVSVDGLRLRQVIVNLVGNAIKFTAGGWVHVRATAHPGSDGVVPFTLEVTDTGPGIPAGQQDMVFDRFVQLDGTTRREHGGAGLGLSISRSLVELMGGRIRVDSVVGRGSTFVVELELPVVQDPSQDPPEAELAVADLRAAVLTDRPRFADAVGSSLRALQAAVLEWDPSRAQPPGACDVVILDAAMSEASWDRAHAILTAPGADGIPLVVLLSGTARRGLGKLSARARLLPAPATRRRLAEDIRLARGGLAATQAEDAQEGGRPPVSTGHAHVLLVEDHVDNQRYALRVLESAGYRVDVAHDGVEGLEKAQRTTYDAILADIQMPNMDGFEFAKSLRRWQQETGAKPVPIVALTAHAVEGFDRLCRESGMTDFVTKPARRPVLLDAVRRQLVAPGDEPDRPAAPEPSIDILIDPDIADLVPSYLSSRSDDAGRMERWLSEGDFDAVRRCAHDVKASGSAYGFPTLTELGGRIGEAARNGDADAVGLGIDLMREYLDRIHWRVRAERE